MVKLTSKIKKVVENNPVAFATAGRGSKPNVIGTAFAKIIGKNQVLITDNFMKQTVKNIKHNKCVCLAVWDKKWKGYKLIGKADYYNKGKWKEFVNKMPENKGMAAKGAIIITVEKLIKLC